MTTRPRVAFVLEQTLGHVTHSANLRSLVGGDDRVEAAFAPIEFARAGISARVPGLGNWTVRSGLRARRAVHRLRRAGTVDGMFVHTQVPAILMPDRLRRIPTVVSLDATPLQYDELGAHYGHETAGSAMERLKWRANRACFARAERIVTWAAWTKQGLIDRYEVLAEKVVVIPPGVDRAAWTPTAVAANARRDGPVRVLFVGGDLDRKGGALLIESVRRLRHEGIGIELDVVTAGHPDPEPGVTVHHGLRPNSAELIARYHAADVFCLPTFGDCLPMVLSEAGAAGLPLVATDVGAIGEIVQTDRSGLLIPVGDGPALTAALRQLALDRAMRRALGAGARHLVEEQFDAARNARRLVDLVLEVVDGRTR